MNTLRDWTVFVFRLVTKLYNTVIVSSHHYFVFITQNIYEILGDSGGSGNQVD